MLKAEPAAATPAVSVVIPTCNRPDQLHECLEALAGALARVTPYPIEVIVTDDSSDDATQRMLLQRHPWIRWARGPRRGPAANRNAGVGIARGTWIVFTDDDCLPGAGWLAAYMEAIGAHPQCRVFEGKTVADRERARLDEEAPVNPVGGYLWSCNMAIRKDLFDSLHGFCESFPYAAMEDADLRLRLLESGETFLFIDAAVVCHPYRRSKGLGFAVKSGRSYLHLAMRHPYLLGPGWQAGVVSLMRRTRLLLHDAYRCRCRGMSYAVGALVVSFYFETLARLRYAGAAQGQSAPVRSVTR